MKPSRSSLGVGGRPPASSPPAPARSRAEVKVDPLVGEHMVVQRDRPVRVAGTAAPGEAVTATIAAAKAATKADANGRWSVTLPALTAGGPYTLKIRGATNALTFSDVWAGEVWVASGQSNMEFPLQRSKGGADAAALGCSGLRLFTVANPPAATPATKVGGEWRRLRRRERGRRSRRRRSTSGASCTARWAFPVGIVQAAVGGTPAEAWTPREALRAEPTLAPMVEALDRAMTRHRAARRAGEEAGRLGGEELPSGPGQPRREGRLGARRRRQVGDDGDPAAVGDRRAWQSTARSGSAAR